MLIPSHSAVEAFEDFAGPVAERVESAQDESATLAELRDFLLPKLLSGELCIRDAEKAVEAVL